jgi:hypothetical protein
MGRPLNKRYFGEPTAGGNEIKCDFHNGTAVVEGHIVRQKGSKKFVVAEIGASDTEYTCTLTTGKLTSALASGEMAITMLMDDSETYQVSKITGRRATLIAPDGTGSNAYDGQSVPWNFTASTSDGAAQVEEAGDDDVAGTDDDDFTNA